MNLKGANVARKMFVNLPVKDLKKSISLFWQARLHFNMQFTDETAACMVVSDNIYAMLLPQDKFKTFTPKQICDATRSTEVLVCLSASNREEVDEIVRKAVAAGGTNLQRAARPRFYVWSRISRPGRTYLGTGFH
jgi:uncharacterized protein